MGKKASPTKKNSNGKIILAVLILVIVSSVMLFINKPNQNAASTLENKQAAVTAAGDLVINKSEVTKTAKFYPVKAGDTQMEVLAVRAEDGTVRTAFNTCQVCFDSGKGYYKQEGDTLVCQNCGNVFSINDIERVKNGCNPVPILKENKTEDNDKILISKSVIESNKSLFENWKR